MIPRLVALLVALMALLLWLGKADAHSWYPNSCCHSGDCRHALPGEVVFTDRGIVVRAGTTSPKGQTLEHDILVPFGDPRIKRFPPEAYNESWGPNDGGIHICIYSYRTFYNNKGTLNEGVRCIFMDPGV